MDHRKLNHHLYIDASHTGGAIYGGRYFDPLWNVKEVRHVTAFYLNRGVCYFDPLQNLTTKI